MSTPEDKLADLEQKKAFLELHQRLIDEKRVEANMPAALGMNLKEINQNITLLLNVVGNQLDGTKAIKDDIRLLKEGIIAIDEKLERLLLMLMDKSLPSD